MQPKDLKFPYRWKDRRPEIRDGVLYIPDYYDKHHEFELPAWEEVFGNSNPVVIEYCSGNGTWIAEKAKDKTKNWIAVEWRFERVQKIWSKKQNQKLDNLFIVCGDARVFISQYLKDQSIGEVYVNFPDPWPKEKHAKNRLFQTSFITELTRTLKSGASLTIVTDDPPYSEQIANVILTNPSWKPAYPAPHYVTEWPGYGASYFDSLWREKGRMIRYFQFLKLKTAILPASVSSDLNWPTLDNPDLIEFDFGWNHVPFFINDPAAFQSYTLALDQFTKDVWPLVKDRAPGIILYRGSLSILSKLVVADGELTPLEAATVFGSYLHRLASFLPDVVTPYCLFTDHASYTPGQVAQLLSQERFMHVELSIQPPSPMAILLPPDELCSPSIIQKITDLLEKQPSLRVIPERRLNELWGGLDELIVFEEALTSQGKRQILGFEAAGGKIRSRGI
jgi:tRNA (guanine-N7-)-methyltransferase